MKDHLVLKKTSRLLFGTPIFIVALLVLSGVLGIMNIRNENIAYQIGILMCFFVGFFVPHYALDKAASLLGKSWVFHGLLPLLFTPIGQLISWLNLIHARSKLKEAAGVARPDLN